ncbi:Tigger transposable element-derived protein 2 [Araneus ventricosus]|uniref:Tigger transposable element-derived protein 2 n=1 Tax=Araneus ventricosus TaxID=182803 RepID=A0A4Y2MY91_ARAVE|nr:Tigger transposable element-derived protein 2 [Araneus ventricosus]
MEPTKRKLVLFTVEQKFQIVSRIEAGETLTKLTKEFGVGASAVGDMRRDSEKIKKSYAASNGKSANLRKTTKCANDEEWATFFTNSLFCEGVPISRIMIQQRALNFNSKLGVSKDIQASSGWLEKFKNRQGICLLTIVGEKLSSDIEAGNSFIAELQDLIVKEKLTADQIYNCD